MNKHLIIENIHMWNKILSLNNLDESKMIWMYITKHGDNFPTNTGTKTYRGYFIQGY